ncbi:shikimate kinase [Alphaproteobacteria bacterium]|nr:shikimate kinase [Alphaproteobacteria bacterium]
MNKLLNKNNASNIDEAIYYINTKIPKKPIIIVGMMGVGKSTIGKILAQSLDKEFYDIDDNIEKKYKMKIYEIFEYYGEKKFRDIEYKEIKSIQKNCNAVIATGGGAFTNKKNISILNMTGLTLWLDASPLIIIERLKRNSSNRPLLKDVNIETYVNNLLIKRNPFYAKANLTMVSSQISKNEIKNKILLAIKKYLMEHKNASNN